MRFHTVAMLCGLAVSGFGDTYPRQTGVDAIHYVFRLTVTDESDTITGEATVDIRFLRDDAEFSLDLASPNGANGMTVAEVNCGGVAAKYLHRDDRLTITLPAPAKAGDRRQCTVKYGGAPASGLYASKNNHGNRGIFSVNWPNLAHQWLPIIDHPYDKATSEFFITAPAKYQVAANGLLQEVRDLVCRFIKT